MEKRTILIIDDEEAIRKGLGRALKKKGYEVEMAESGEKGLEIFKSQKFQLVITDLMMGGISGIETLERVKQIEPETMVIIITGHGELDTAIKALRSGASDYLLKPCKNEEIFFRVAGCFEKFEMKMQIKAFEKFMPLCSFCKKIRDDTNREHGTGDWLFLDEYLERHTDYAPTHGVCPDCYKKTIDNLNEES